MKSFDFVLNTFFSQNMLKSFLEYINIEKHNLKIK